MLAADTYAGCGAALHLHSCEYSAAIIPRAKLPKYATNDLQVQNSNCGHPLYKWGAGLSECMGCGKYLLPLDAVVGC